MTCTPKDNTDTKHCPKQSSRRTFLQTTAGALATAAVIGGCDKEDMAGEDSGPGDGPGSGNTDPRDTENVGPSPANRVVRVTDPGATSWDGDDPSDFYQYADQDVVDSMFEEGLLALTNQTDLTEAWRALVPYNDGELVMLHVNAYANNSNDRKNNVAAPISAIVYGLVDLLGIPAENVVVTDPSRNLQGSPADRRIIEGCRHNESISWDLHRGEWGAAIQFTQGQGPNAEERIARIVEEADHIIMVPVLSWHGFNWITGAMKMIMGSISNMAALHDSGMGDWKDGAALADICMPLKDKVRLVAGDGLFGNISGNNDSPHVFQTLGGRGSGPSSTIYLSRDMVALDCVMYDDLLDEARAVDRPKSGYGCGFLSYAADAGHALGTYEMKDETGASSYSEIDFVAIDR